MQYPQRRERGHGSRNAYSEPKVGVELEEGGRGGGVTEKDIERDPGEKGEKKKKDAEE